MNLFSSLIDTIQTEKCCDNIRDYKFLTHHLICFFAFLFVCVRVNSPELVKGLKAAIQFSEVKMKNNQRRTQTQRVISFSNLA